MKIKEILELTQTENENVLSIAKNRLTIGEKRLREILKQVGCINQSGKKGWMYMGNTPEVLEKSVYDFVPPRKNQTPKAKKITINPENHDIIKEEYKPTNKETDFKKGHL